MPVSFNQVTLGGYVGRDPELKETKNGKPMLRLSLATVGKPFGEGTDEVTYWHTVMCWGPIASWVAKSIRKGQYVIAVGELRPRRWQQNGEWRSSNDVTALAVTTAAKTHAEDDEEVPAASESKSPSKDDDLPF